MAVMASCRSCRMAGCTTKFAGAPGVHQADALVRSRPGVAHRCCPLGWGRRGSTARQLLVDGAVGIEKNVLGFAVHTGKPGERDGHPRLLGDLADNRLRGRVGDLGASSGQPQWPSSIRRTRGPRRRCYGRSERRGQHIVRARRVRIPVVITQPHDASSFVSSVIPYVVISDQATPASPSANDRPRRPADRVDFTKPVTTPDDHSLTDPRGQ